MRTASLRGLLLRYLLLTFPCVWAVSGLVDVFGILLNSGFLLPASSAAEACSRLPPKCCPI